MHLEGKIEDARLERGGVVVFGIKMHDGLIDGQLRCRKTVEQCREEGFHVGCTLKIEIECTEQH